MALFRRKSDIEEPETTTHSPVSPDEHEAQVPERGPYDADILGERGNRLDLGALWLPGREGLEVRMEVDKRPNVSPELPSNTTTQSCNSKHSLHRNDQDSGTKSAQKLAPPSRNKAAPLMMSPVPSAGNFWSNSQ